MSDKAALATIERLWDSLVWTDTVAIQLDVLIDLYGHLLSCDTFTRIDTAITNYYIDRVGSI